MCKYALICEGKAETAILNILLDNELLIFNRSDILDEIIISTRSFKLFATSYLNFKLTSKLVIYRIIDSKNENFKVSKQYFDMIEAINIITNPEIEVLILSKYGYLDTYMKKHKSKYKPSEYAKVKIKGYKKTEAYWISEFSDVDQLCACIRDASRYSNAINNLLDIMK